MQLATNATAAAAFVNGVVPPVPQHRRALVLFLSIKEIRDVTDYNSCERTIQSRD